jgi:5-methylcytosine-specific restriction endonuclease McrA
MSVDAEIYPLKRRMFEAQRGLCWLCNQPMLLIRGEQPLVATFDHIVPVSLGGTWDEENLKLAHKICNNRRGNQPWNPTPRDLWVGDVNAPPFSAAWLRARGYIRG